LGSLEHVLLSFILPTGNEKVIWGPLQIQFIVYLNILGISEFRMSCPNELLMLCVSSNVGIKYVLLMSMIYI